VKPKIPPRRNNRYHSRNAAGTFKYSSPAAHMTASKAPLAYRGNCEASPLDEFNVRQARR
jgi:hypothetical protein